jgi:hypothetical protein
MGAWEALGEGEAGQNMGEESRYTAGTKGEGVGYPAEASGLGRITLHWDSEVRRSGRSTSAAAATAALDVHAQSPINKKREAGTLTFFRR